MSTDASCLLAVEASASPASLALFQGGRLLAVREVESGARRSQALLDAAAGLVAETGVGWAGIDRFAVGRGPGNYTGLRVSLTAAQGWALPAGKPVWVVSSGAALAAEYAAAHPDVSRLVVWGPSRRGHLWAGLFLRQGGHAILPQQVGEWRVIPESERASLWSDAHWLEPGWRPKAEWVGRLCLAGVPSEPPQPLYLNPAVAKPAGDP